MSNKKNIEEKTGHILKVLEKEALSWLESFKKHPIKSIIMAIIILLGVKLIYKIIRG